MGAVSPPLPPQGDLRSLLPAHRAPGHWGQLRKVVPGLSPQRPLPHCPEKGPLMNTLTPQSSTVLPDPQVLPSTAGLTLC